MNILNHYMRNPILVIAQKKSDWGCPQSEETRRPPNNDINVPFTEKRDNNGCEKFKK